MALILDSTYNNVFYKNVLVKLRDIINDDRDYGAIYIAPAYADHGTYSVRLWGEGAETTQLVMPIEWTKLYRVSVSLYSLEPSPNENFWEQFLQDGERLYQLMANNNNVSGSLGWFDGQAEDMRIQDVTDDESAIDGLWAIKYDFVCRITRVD